MPKCARKASARDENVLLTGEVRGTEKVYPFLGSLKSRSVWLLWSDVIGRSCSYHRAGFACGFYVT